MDVRCEKCGTEYEFDEGKLKPGGVTVKCAECGHMFRVRKRSPTNLGAPAPASSPPPVPGRVTPNQSGGLSPASGTSQRVWLVRDEEGKVQTCRELATLQQWVVAGRVTRECQISRTGKSWKRLGSIAELGSFFRIAEEARRATSGVRPASKAPTNGEPQAAAASAPPPEPAAAPQPAPVEKTDPLPGATQPPAKRESGPPPATRPRTSRPLPAAGGTPNPDESADARNSAGWAAAPAKFAVDEQTGPRGPVGGLSRGVPTQDAAFAASATNKKAKGPTVDDIMPKTFEPTDAYDDVELPASGAARWVALVSVLLLAGAAVAVYFFVFRSEDQVDKPGVLAGGELDAGAATDEPIAPAVDPQEALSASYADLRADTPLSLGAAGARLETLTSDDPIVAARLLAARARVLTARAQHILDKGGDDAGVEAKKLADEAAQLAADALAEDTNSLEARVAMADALRLRRGRTGDVEHHLKIVLQGDPRNREGRYVRAMLRARDGDTDEARELLTELTEDGSDVRVIYRLARLDFADEKPELAKTRVERVLAVQPEHTGASALADEIEQSAAVVQTDPMPPEVGAGDDDDDDGGGGGGGGGGARGGGYDSLLARADRLAENGKCRQAMDIYRRALDDNPAGVGALVGIGYCHIDARQFASAHAKFRAALGISSRHHGALIGIAEAYRYQGLKKQAIEAYRKYLEIHPGGPRAPMARKQIERLGGSVGGGDGAGDGADPKPDDPESDVPEGDPFEDPAPPKKDTEDLGEREDPGAQE